MRGLLSSHEVFDKLHRLDLQNPFSLDLDGIPGRWVAASAGRALRDLE